MPDTRPENPVEGQTYTNEAGHVFAWRNGVWEWTGVGPGISPRPEDAVSYDEVVALMEAGMGEEDVLGSLRSRALSESVEEKVPGLLKQLKDSKIDTMSLYGPTLGITEEAWAGLDDKGRARAYLIAKETGGVARATGEVEPEEESDFEKFMREQFEGGGAGGGASDIGPNQMLIEREKMANAILIEKMQEEHMAKTGERSMVIDLMGDLLNREVSRHTMARDYVDRLLQSAGMTVPKGMEYAPGLKPGGAFDRLSSLGGGEPTETSFPRKIQTTPIPTHLLRPDITPHDEAVNQSIAGAGRASAAVGLKSGGVVSRSKASELLGFQGGFGDQMSADAARKLLGLPTGGYDPYAQHGGGGPSDPFAASDPNVMVGGDILNQEWLMNLAGKQEERYWSGLSGYMPDGAPTAEMQKAELDYKTAVEAASMYASGTVEAAQASAAATEAAAALHAAASRYAADQGLKGDEVRAAADRYVADVGARTAGERLAFDKARTQAQLAANPRTIFESLFLNRGMQPGAGVMGLQQQVTPPGTFDVPGVATSAAVPTQAEALGASPISAQEQMGGLLSMRGMRSGGQVHEGPIIARVGERSPKSKTHETSEYALLAPGSVIAPQEKGEEPTMRNAMSAIFNQIAKTKPKSKPAKTQAGATVAPAPDPWADYFKKAGTGGLPTAQAGVVSEGDPNHYNWALARRPNTSGRIASKFATRSNALMGQPRVQQALAARSAAAANLGGGTNGGGDGGGGGTSAPSAVPANTTPAGQTVGDIPLDVIPAELLNAPAFGGAITSSLMRPMAIRGAFGKTAGELSEQFNPLATSAYDLARLGPDELKAKQALLSLLGMSPDSWFEGSRRATMGAYGQPLGVPGGYARQTAGRLIR